MHVLRGWIRTIGAMRIVLMAASAAIAIAGLLAPGVIGQLMVVAGIQGVIGFAAAGWFRRVTPTLMTPRALIGFVLGVAVVWIGTPSQPNPIWSDQRETLARVTHLGHSPAYFLYEYQVDGTTCRGQGGQSSYRVGDMLTIYYPHAEPCWSRRTPIDPETFTIAQGVSVAAGTPLFGLGFALLLAKIGRRRFGAHVSQTP